MKKCLKHQPKLENIMSHLNEKSILVGFDQNLIPIYISVINRLIAGEDADDIAKSLRMRTSDLTRLALRFSRLTCFAGKLFDKTTSIDFPCVWSASAGDAMRYLKRNFCASLELPDWRIQIEGMRPVLLSDINLG